MAHARTQIRNSIKSLLTGLASTGGRVFGPEKTSFSGGDLPALSLFTKAENTDSDIESGRIASIQYRAVELVVEGRVKMSGDVDAALDDISAEVETAIYSNEIQGVRGLDLISTEKEFGEDEKRVGKITLTFTALYLTEDGAPGILI